MKEVTLPKDWSFFRTAVDSPSVVGGGEITRRVARFGSKTLVTDMIEREIRGDGGEALARESIAGYFEIRTSKENVSNVGCEMR